LPVDPGRLLGSLSRAIGVVDCRPGELEERLDELVKIAAAVFDVAGAGLMLIDDESRLRLVGASDDAGRALEMAQQQAGEGPGVQATRRRELVTLTDFSRDGRWPEIHRAVAPFGVVSVISAPIYLRGQAVGNLNLFDRVAREWTQADRDGVTVFAGVAAALLRIALEARHSGQLVAELSNRFSSERFGSDDA
jgi:GAF domain-containing protein